MLSTYFESLVPVGFTVVAMLMIVWSLVTFISFYFLAHLGWTILSNNFALVIVTVLNGLMGELHKILHTRNLKYLPPHTHTAWRGTVQSTIGPECIFYKSCYHFRCFRLFKVHLNYFSKPFPWVPTLIAKT